MQLGQGFDISNQKPPIVQDNMGTAIDHHNNQRMGGKGRGKKKEREGGREREVYRVHNQQRCIKSCSSLSSWTTRTEIDTPATIVSHGWLSWGRDRAEAMEKLVTLDWASYSRAQRISHHHSHTFRRSDKTKKVQSKRFRSYRVCTLLMSTLPQWGEGEGEKKERE
jgi:hypothetical protein